MDFSRFSSTGRFCRRKLSILIFITGLIAIPLLPVSEYPDVVPLRAGARRVSAPTRK